MFPEFRLFGREIYMYPLMSIIGLLVMGLWVCYQVRRKSADDNEALLLMLFCGIGVLIGSHLMYGITNIKYWPLLLRAKDFGQWFFYAKGIFGGAVFYGGLIGGMIAAFFCFKSNRWDYKLYGDILAPSVPLFHGFARIGCFLGGCCYGVPSSFGFTYTHSMYEAADGICRFPVQLLESTIDFALFFVLAWLLRRGICSNRLFPIYLICYSVIRFCDEFLRGDEVRGFLLGLSTSQFISILLLITGIIWIAVENKKIHRKATV